MSEPTASAVRSGVESIVAGRSASLRRRYLRDRLARWVVWSGGLGVIAALLLIFVYLLSEVVPLFAPAELQPRPAFAMPGPDGHTLFVAAEEQGEVGLRVTDGGIAVFFDLHDGRIRDQVALPVNGARMLEVTAMSDEHGMLAALLDDGRVSVFRHSYVLSYPHDRRVISPRIELPYGDLPLTVVDGPVRALVARSERDVLMFAAVDIDGQLALKQYERRESLLGEIHLDEGPLQRVAPAVPADALLLDPQLNWLYVFDHAGGRIALYRLGAEPQLQGIYETGSPIRMARHLAGGISIVVAQADGVVSQWFPARDADNTFYLARVREFRAGAHAISAIGPELRRRTFAVGDVSGAVTLFHATSARHIGREIMLDEPIAYLSFNPRAQYLMAVGRSGQMRGYEIRNEHPEVSLRALWGRVWYESYDGPRFIWQSSAAVADFEPKLSLTPLAFGTLKAAFYAMLFAVPLAILGAIYTANFMAPAMRQTVKPTVELMEALPTVILGFLAGLWLAPFVERNLPGVFLTLMILPLSIPLVGFAWTRLPRAVRLRVPPGWEAAMLVPVIAVIVWACFAVAGPVEAVIFDGNMQGWMDRTLGIGYDQRNALVVGIAMGVAVIPTIYSIAEDAIFSVPKQLSLGSLALGATPWQTLVGVVLPTASPGIFSAVMIGMGRAVGETMIVLMATGNTAVMDFSLFQGLRTMSANIAVEMPEAEVGSTHFRLLFVAGLVLFVFTFVFNTIAELVRQRLRRKYATI